MSILYDQAQSDHFFSCLFTYLFSCGIFYAFLLPAIFFQKIFFLQIFSVKQILYDIFLLGLNWVQTSAHKGDWEDDCRLLKLTSTVWISTFVFPHSQIIQICWSWQHPIQQAHNLKTTSYHLQCGIMTSDWRQYDIVLKSCASWVDHAQSYLYFSLYNSLFFLIVPSADNFFNKFGTRSGPTKCWAWSGSKLFDWQSCLNWHSIWKTFILKKVSSQQKSMKNVTHSLVCWRQHPIGEYSHWSHDSTSHTHILHYCVLNFVIKNRSSW